MQRLCFASFLWILWSDVCSVLDQAYYGPSPAGRCYHYTDTDRRWDDAKDFCSGMSNGALANLPATDTDVEMAYLSMVGTEKNRNIWIDYRHDGTGLRTNTSNYRDSGGQSIPMTSRWSSRSPYAYDCILLFRADYYNLLDRACTVRYRALCIVAAAANCPEAQISPAGDKKGDFTPNQFFHCADGYKPETTPPVCQCNGQWSSAPPSCVPLADNTVVYGPSPAGRCYLIDLDTSHRAEAWIKSKAYCEGVTAGAKQLTFPDTGYIEEIAYLKEIGSKHFIAGSWTGYRDFDSRPNPKDAAYYTSSAGANLPFNTSSSVWGAGQPSTYREDCITMWPGRWRMHDALCFGGHLCGTICELPQGCIGKISPTETKTYALGEEFACATGYQPSFPEPVTCQCNKQFDPAPPDCILLTTVTSTNAPTTTAVATTTKPTLAPATLASNGAKTSTPPAEPKTQAENTDSQQAAAAVKTGSCAWFGKEMTYASCGTTAVLICLAIALLLLAITLAISCNARTSKAC